MKNRKLSKPNSESARVASKPKMRGTLDMNCEFESEALAISRGLTKAVYRHLSTQPVIVTLAKNHKRAIEQRLLEYFQGPVES
jgi:hypothetical protein